MKFAVSIATYARPDKRTPFYLERALTSVFDQSHSDFKIFLIGDRYDNSDEFNAIASKFSSNQIYFENLPTAKERDSYTDRKAIWAYGGVTAVNYSIELALKNEFEFICHLDHDDFWMPTHLFEIDRCIKQVSPAWMCTRSTHMIPNKILPEFHNSSKFVNAYPFSGKLIHSSVCMNFKKIPLRYRDIFAETGKIGLPADADLWERTRHYLKENNLKGCYINSLTCRHDEEGYSKIK
jgi:hypothetical protein